MCIILSAEKIPEVSYWPFKRVHLLSCYFGSYDNLKKNIIWSLSICALRNALTEFGRATRNLDGWPFKNRRGAWSSVTPSSLTGHKAMSQMRVRSVSRLPLSAIVNSSHFGEVDIALIPLFWELARNWRFPRSSFWSWLICDQLTPFFGSFLSGPIDFTFFSDCCSGAHF